MEVLFAVNKFTFFVLGEWLMFDDDNVTAVTDEDVLKLSGGGLLKCKSLLKVGVDHYFFC